MIKRSIESFVSEQLNYWPIILLTGARQIGKTTLCKQFSMYKGFDYVSLDNIDDRKLAINDPKLFLSVHKLPLIIDEVQYAPVLFEVINEIVNKRKFDESNPNGLFILTGSQSFEHMRRVTQSLAGRVCIVEMTPLSENEIIGRKEIPFLPDYPTVLERQSIPYKNKSETFKRIVRGRFPELLSSPNLSPAVFYQNYVKTYLDRDVSELINVKDKMKFHDLLTQLASLTGQELNYESISKSLGITLPTVKQWCSVLEASGIIFMLRAYNDSSLTKRLTKRPKMFFTDTGLASSLIKMQDPKSLELCYLSGAFFETFVINEIRKSYLNCGKEFSGYYYRDTNQNEIDLVIIENARLHLIEIKSGYSFSPSDVSSFKSLSSSQYSISSSCIIGSNEKVSSLSDNIIVVPVRTI